MSEDESSSDDLPLSALGKKATQKDDSDEEEFEDDEVEEEMGNEPNDNSDDFVLLQLIPILW